jgi:hypothetical protein
MVTEPLRSVKPSFACFHSGVEPSIVEEEWDASASSPRAAEPVHLGLGVASCSLTASVEPRALLVGVGEDLA